MVSEQTTGKSVLGLALILIGIYIYMILSPNLWWWVVTIAVSIIVLGALGMMAWIGWGIARTPPIEILNEVTEEKRESP